MNDKWKILQAAASLDEFVELPLETQALYFHLAIHAEGTFISNPKAITRGIKATEYSLKQLDSCGLIHLEDNGVSLTTLPVTKHTSSFRSICELLGERKDVNT